MLIFTYTNVVHCKDWNVVQMRDAKTDVIVYIVVGNSQSEEFQSLVFVTKHFNNGAQLRHKLNEFIFYNNSRQKKTKKEEQYKISRSKMKSGKQQQHKCFHQNLMAKYFSFLLDNWR